ncbi:MAG TPA: asparaginase [Planctomycetes bacterium]|nr:asparaginase [Planctomycetota bacterium]
MQSAKALACGTRNRGDRVSILHRNAGAMHAWIDVYEHADTSRQTPDQVSVLDVMLSSLELYGIDLQRIPLMNKDSLEMTQDDHDLIAETAGSFAKNHDGILIVHGTDKLHITGERICELLVTPVPIVLTGAMKPWELRTTDAMQNLTEALTAIQLVGPGVYVAMHNRVLKFPGVTKDIQQGAFVKL